MNFLETLRQTLTQRRERNSNYSLRAFARDLGTDHATLSQILRGRRRLSSVMVTRLGRKLRMTPSAIAEACAQSEAETILELIRRPSFQTGSRWIAMQTGLHLDSVNTALHRLLHSGVLVMESVERWTTTRPPYA